MDGQHISALIETLFRDWGPSLARYAYRLAADTGAAEDLVQEAFMALYLELQRGTEIDNPRGWTLTVVRHLAAKRTREQICHPETRTAPEILERVQDPSPFPAAAEEPDDITKLFTVLSKREVEVLLLRVESRKYKEIASLLGIQLKTVETLLARALRKLRAAANLKAQGARVPELWEKNVPKTLQ